MKAEHRVSNKSSSQSCFQVTYPTFN